jgi:acetyl-CoA acyltransferase
MNLGRVVSLGAGLPIETCGMTVNRFCSSGIQAIADATAKIQAGWSEVIIAGGAESMSHIPMGGSIFRPHPGWDDLPNTYVSMGITAENVAERFNISREDQDKVGMESNRRAHEAIENGIFKEQIIPVMAWKYTTDKQGKKIHVEVPFEMDDGVRWPTSMEKMAQLKSPFKEGGSVTAANSSQMTDGAAFTLLMSAEKAKKLGFNPVAKLTHYAVAGVEPEIMGVGPAYAIPKVLKQAGLKTRDIDLFEINEAFSGSSFAINRVLELDTDKVNVNGGSVALGHPIGASGARLLTTLLYEMKKQDAETGLVSLCLGGGEAVALVINR